MSAVLNWLVGAALVVGLFFHTMGVLGILRFPDVYTRLHADTKATTFGSIFIALAAILTAVRYGVAAAPGEGGAWANVVVHIAFAVVVLAVTNATGGHAIARAAWRAGHRPAEAVVDALAADAAASAVEGQRSKVEGRGEEAPEKAAEATEAVEAGEGGEAGEVAEGPEISEKSEISELSEGTRQDAASPEGEMEEARLEAAPPEAACPEGASAEGAAPAETFPKAASTGWAAVLGITAEDPLLQAADAPAAETVPEGSEAGEEEKA